MSTIDFEKWMKTGKYLPDFMRDFHAQKRVFKRINEIVENDKKGERPHHDMPNWVTAHIYVVDFFLWYMGRRGYTLQKSRADQPFINIADDLNDFDRREFEEFSNFIREVSSG